MNKLLMNIRRWRLWALFLKELRQIKRNKQLIASLIVPPTVQLLIFGFALNPEVTGLRLGVVNESQSAISRDLVSAFVENNAFELKGYYASSDELGQALRRGELDGGLIIPVDFAKQRERGVTAKVQLLLDAVNSNTAGIAAGYAQRIIGAFNVSLAPSGTAITLQSNGAPTITSNIALLYNPGLRNSWFILTGVLGILLVLNGSLVAASAMVR